MASYILKHLLIDAEKVVFSNITNPDIIDIEGKKYLVKNVKPYVGVKPQNIPETMEIKKEVKDGDYIIKQGTKEILISKAEFEKNYTEVI